MMEMVVVFFRMVIVLLLSFHDVMHNNRMCPLGATRKGCCSDPLAGLEPETPAGEAQGEAGGCRL